MELRASLWPLGPGSERVLASLLPPEALVFQNGRCSVNVEDPVFARILKAGDAGAGFWVHAEPVFSTPELKGVTHFELVNRSAVEETDKDYEANEALRERTAIIDAGGEGGPVRLVSGFSLRKIRLKPNTVGSIGGARAEFLIGSAVAQVFEKAGFTGFSLRPITNSRTGLAYEEYSQIFSEVLMAPAIIDCSVQRVRTRDKEFDGRLRHLGCLAYHASALTQRPDFNRTAEPWAGWDGWPSWVVSARVMKLFKSSKLRGWQFRPVLTSDSDVYSQYLALWRKLVEPVGATTKSTMSGGR